MQLSQWCSFRQWNVLNYLVLTAIEWLSTAQTIDQLPRLVQVSRTCLVYDETPNNKPLIDESSGSPCVVFTLQPQTQHNNRLIYNRQDVRQLTNLASTKLLSTDNPLARYLTIEAGGNFTLKTLEHVDREAICASLEKTDGSSRSSIVGSQLFDCCRQGVKECVSQLTILVRLSSRSTSSLSNSDDLQQNSSQSQFIRLNVRLIDVNDNAPRFSRSRHQLKVSEGMRVGSRLPLPQAEDRDSTDYGIARYYLTPTEEVPFELVQLGRLDESGESMDNNLASSIHDFSSPHSPSQRPIGQLYLKITRPLDWEKQKSYSFVLVAEDRGSPALTGQAEITINIKDENDNHPVFVNKTYTVHVRENTLPNHRLVQLQAVDPDQGWAGQVVYSLAPPNGVHQYQTGSSASNNSSSSSMFKIDPSTGWLSTVNPLDYEEASRHVIRAIARDKAGHPGFDEASVIVLVIDVNDVAPYITVDPVVTSSNRPSDRDQQQQRHRHDQLAVDIYVDESAANQLSDQLLALVGVSDPDTGDGGQFECLLVEPDQKSTRPLFDYGRPAYPLVDRSSNFGKFVLSPISQSQYELKSTGPFDHELAKVEKVKIFCSDFGQPRLTSVLTLTVHVQDANDNRPKFSLDHYEFTIDENRTSGTIVDRVTATDADSGSNAQLTYSIDGIGADYFRIDDKDGTLYSNAVFDSELRQTYQFHVYAQDDGHPVKLTSTASVQVNIKDINDNSPEFVGLNTNLLVEGSGGTGPRLDNGYLFQVAENEPINTHVGVLLGIDADVGKPNDLHFRLLTATSAFRLNSQTGELVTSQELDREQQSSYEMVAMLTDSGQPRPRTATVKVKVDVLDVNDHAPVVVFPAANRIGGGNVSVSFRERPGEVVARIEARDPDEGHNSLLHYSLIGGNRNGLFRIGSTSAELVVDRDLGKDDIGAYKLDILIQDSGMQPQSTQVQLQVTVTDTPPRLYSHRTSPTGESSQDRAYGSSKQRSGVLLSDSTDATAYQEGGSGMISASAILVAIVALSCAIILVLVGITLYLCSRRRHEFNRSRRVAKQVGGPKPPDQDRLDQHNHQDHRNNLLVKSGLTYSNTVDRTSPLRASGDTLTSTTVDYIDQHQAFTMMPGDNNNYTLMSATSQIPYSDYSRSRQPTVAGMTWAVHDQRRQRPRVNYEPHLHQRQQSDSNRSKTLTHHPDRCLSNRGTPLSEGSSRRVYTTLGQPPKLRVVRSLEHLNSIGSSEYKFKHDAKTVPKNPQQFVQPIYNKQQAPMYYEKIVPPTKALIPRGYESLDSDRSFLTTFMPTQSKCNTGNLVNGGDRPNPCSARVNDQFQIELIPQVAVNKLFDTSVEHHRQHQPQHSTSSFSNSPARSGSSNLLIDLTDSSASPVQHQLSTTLCRCSNHQHHHAAIQDDLIEMQPDPIHHLYHNHQQQDNLQHQPLQPLVAFSSTSINQSDFV